MEHDYEYTQEHDLGQPPSTNDTLMRLDTDRAGNSKLLMITSPTVSYLFYLSGTVRSECIGNESVDRTS